MSEHRHHDRAGDARLLTTALALVAVFMVTEVVSGVLSGSLVLIADAGHMLVDAGAIAGSIIAARLALRPAGGVWTYGFHRAEILATAGNGIALLVATALIVAEAISRLLHPTASNGTVMIAVGSAGLLVNGAAAWTLHRGNPDNLNLAGSLQHVLTDIWAVLGTIIAGAVVLATGTRRADPIASLIVAGLMVDAARRLLTASGRVLLEAAPEGIDLAEVRTHLLGAPHVTDVHDLHVWTVTSDLPALSAHVVVADRCFDEGHVPRILDALQACLVGHFDLEHSTFQLEPAGHIEHETGAHG